MERFKNKQVHKHGNAKRHTKVIKQILLNEKQKLCHKCSCSNNSNVNKKNNITD